MAVQTPEMIEYEKEQVAQLPDIHVTYSAVQVVTIAYSALEIMQFESEEVADSATGLTTEYETYLEAPWTVEEAQREKVLEAAEEFINLYDPDSTDAFSAIYNVYWPTPVEVETNNVTIKPDFGLTEEQQNIEYDTNYSSYGNLFASILMNYYSDVGETTILDVDVDSVIEESEEEEEGADLPSDDRMSGDKSAASEGLVGSVTTVDGPISVTFPGTQTYEDIENELDHTPINIVSASWTESSAGGQYIELIEGITNWQFISGTGAFRVYREGYWKIEYEFSG